MLSNHRILTSKNSATMSEGEDVIIVPAVSNEEAEKRYPDGQKTLKPYLRVVPQPK